MSGMGWALVGSGGLAVGLAIALAMVALRNSGLKDTLRTIDGARAELKHQVTSLTLDLHMAIEEGRQTKSRLAKQLEEARRDLKVLRDKHLQGASSAELADAFDMALGKTK